MRYFEIASGIRIEIDSEERALLDRVIEKLRIAEIDLDERDQHVAWTLCVKGVLLKSGSDDEVFYEPNDDIHIWRFR